MDEWGPKRRTRKRRASNLADDLTREGIEAYFEAKQRELEAPEQDAPAPEILPDVPETAEPAAQPYADFALDVYDLDRSDVSEMASDLQKAHIHRSRDKGKPFMDEREEHLRRERARRRDREVEQRLVVRTPRSADKDTQLGE